MDKQGDENLENYGWRTFKEWTNASYVDCASKADNRDP